MRSWKTVVLCNCAALFATLAPAMAAQRVFLSSAQSTGDLGGLEGADATCQRLADAAGLGGRWVAWLSIADLAAINRLVGDGPFTLLGTEDIIAANRAELTSGNLRDEIDRTEMGIQLPASVWTGTDPDGSAADSGNFCDGWTDPTNGSFGQIGLSQATDANWTNSNQIFCDLDARLYCFEQGSASGAPVLSWTALAAMAVLLLLAGAWRISGAQRRGA